MNKVYASHSDLAARVAETSQEYANIIGRALIESDAGGAWYDADHEGWQAAKEFRVAYHVAHRPGLIRQVGTYTWAKLTGKSVSLEVRNERMATCLKCTFVDMKDGPKCSICGCPTVSISSLEESLPSWGCKHPERSVGLGWKR